MELFNNILHLIDNNLILCLIPVLLSLGLINIISRRKIQINQALELISWIIIIYSSITLAISVYSIITYPGDIDFIKSRMDVYFVLFFLAAVFPFSLLFKKLRSKYWFVLLAAFLIKIGSYLEIFVITITSMLRDYENFSSLLQYGNLVSGIALRFLQGLIITILILASNTIYNKLNTTDKKTRFRAFRSKDENI